MSRSKDTENAPLGQTEKQANVSFRDIEDARLNEPAMAQVLIQFQRVMNSRVRRFIGRGIHEDDLRQIAFVAIRKAIIEMPLNGVGSINGYVARTIDHAITDELRNQAPCNRQQWDAISEYKKAESAIYEKTGKHPASTEVYQKLGWSNLKISRHRALCSQKVQSLDAILEMTKENGSGIEVERSNRPDSESRFSNEEHEHLARLEGLISSDLTPDEEKLIRKRYFAKMSQKKYAKEENLTEHAVRRMESCALAKLKEALMEHTQIDQGLEG